MESNVNETQKGTSLRESASFEQSCAKIRRRVWPVGELPKKRVINKFLKNSVIFHPFAQKPPWTDVHQIWHSCRGRRRNHLWQIFGDRFMGVDSVVGKNCRFPLTKPVAVNAGLALPRSPWLLLFCYHHYCYSKYATDKIDDIKSTMVMTSQVTSSNVKQ